MVDLWEEFGDALFRGEEEEVFFVAVFDKPEENAVFDGGGEVFEGVFDEEDGFVADHGTGIEEHFDLAFGESVAEFADAVVEVEVVVGRQVGLEEVEYALGFGSFVGFAAVGDGFEDGTTEEREFFADDGDVFA